MKKESFRNVFQIIIKQNKYELELTACQGHTEKKIYVTQKGISLSF